MNRKYILYFLLLFSFQFQLLGQANQDYKKQFKQKVTFFPQEKVFLHSDKPYYFTGETVWFKLYVVDATYHTPSAISKVAYVEIIGKDNLPIFQEKIKLEEGTGRGQFYINAKIGTGVYRIRAYTALMKNQPQDYFFEREINLINPFKTHFETIPEIDNYTIRFFPEGGVMVNGLKSRVGVEIINNLGEPVSDTLHIYSGDHLSSYCVTSELGLGSFEISPVSGMVYSASIDVNNQSIKVSLPKANDNGVVLNYDHELCSVDVESKNTKYDSLKLLIHSRNNLELLVDVEVANGKASQVIDKNKLQSGIHHITIMDMDYQPLAERLFFTYPKKQDKCKVKLSDTAFVYREKVNIQLELNSDFNSSSNVSLSVYKANETLSRTSNNPISYLFLESDLDGFLQNTEYYFQNNAKAAELDEALLVYGWRKFDWNNLMSNLTYLPEIQSPIVNGQIIETAVNPDNILAVYSGINAQIYSFSPREDNSFSFETSPFIDGSNLSFWSDKINLENVKIEVEDPFIEKDTDYVEKFIKTDADMLSFIQDYALDIQFANSYVNKTKGRGESNQQSLSYPFYGIPDASYILEDYTQFPTLEEVFKEYVRYATTRKKNGIKQLHVKDFDFRSIDYNQPALTLIDGIPIKNIDYLWSLSPEEVNRIDVISRRYTSGNMAINGLINVVTHKGNLGGLQLPEDVKNKIYKSLLLPRDFYSPVYTDESINGRIPDYRNTLLWDPAPDVSGGRIDLDFYTSDTSGDYILEIIGIGSNGELLYETSTFKVLSGK